MGLAVLIALYAGQDKDPDLGEAATTKPVLAVVMTKGRLSTIPRQISATGNIVPWQEASIGTEAEGLQLIDVKVNVGDRVRQGQVLAVFKSELVAADLAEAQANVAQAQAQLMEAESNEQRVRGLDTSGAMSAQQVDQYVVAARLARGRLDAARAVVERNRLRLAQTRVLAPSDGIISSRTATVGAVMPGGQELFRLIRGGRLEWRANVAMPDISALAAGQVVSISVQGQAPLRGRVRMVAPSVDMQTHTGLAYVDLPIADNLKAGTFARGHVQVGDAQGMTVPQQAVLLRDGYSYVMRLDARSKVLLTKVSVGRRLGDRIEITQGLKASEPIIASGLTFLSEGDMVRVVSSGTRAAAPTAGAP